LDFGLEASCRSAMASFFFKSKIQNPPGAVAERLMHFAVDEDDDGSSPFGLANTILDFGLKKPPEGRDSKLIENPK
jgi:hypothetical protein